MAADWKRAASLSEVPEGELLGVVVDGHSICLANVEGEVYALKDNCSHKDYPLSEGILEEDGTLECSWHGARFDCASGRALSLPAIHPVKTYEVRLEDGEIFVQVESDG